MDGKISSCGGEGGYDKCYDYDIGRDEWTEVASGLSEDRLYPSSSLVGEDDDEWLISGAYGGYGSDTTEVRVGGISTPGPRLPDGIYYGCQVSLNDTHVFFADGFDRWATVLDYERGRFQEQVRMATRAGGCALHCSKFGNIFFALRMAPQSSGAIQAAALSTTRITGAKSFWSDTEPARSST